MKKFLVLYRSPISAAEQMAKADPAQAKAGMDAWLGWAKKSGSALVDLGSPLGETTTFGKGPSTQGPGYVGGYSIMQAESAKALNRLLEEHPHLSQPGTSIQVIEALSIAGM